MRRASVVVTSLQGNLMNEQRTCVAQYFFCLTCSPHSDSTADGTATAVLGEAPKAAASDVAGILWGDIYLSVQVIYWRALSSVQ